jgi:cytochrome c-type biogenesis protein CcmE
VTRKSRRLTIIFSAVSLLALAAGLVLFALRDNVVFFYTPSEVVEKSVEPGTRLRLGGLVKKGSVQRDAGKSIKFIITDVNRELAVSYVGLLPDLFREGQGVVAEGVLETASTFRADSVLAKHDEKYMPRELTDSLKKQGYFKHGEKSKAAPAGGKKP